ncbi:somatostatin receptor type 3-like [Oculina patagonica]
MMAEHLTHAELIIWTLAFALECFVIIVGNAVAIYVFWKQRSTLKRTRYLLINLSVADFMVGICAIDNIVCFPMKNQGCKIVQKATLVDASFGMASLLFLVLVSLERLYAVVSPLRQRASKTSMYFYFILASWISSAMLFLVIYPIFNHYSISITVKPVIFSVLQMLGLIIICVAYSIILVYSKKEDPRLQEHQRQQSKNLAKTIFIVAFLSVLTWLPHAVINILRYVAGIQEGEMYRAGQVFRMANSFINPIVYCYRMPEFRNTLRKRFVKKPQVRVIPLENFHSIAVSPTVMH